MASDNNNNTSIRYPIPMIVYLNALFLSEAYSDNKTTKITKVRYDSK